MSNTPITDRPEEAKRKGTRIIVVLLLAIAAVLAAIFFLPVPAPGAVIQAAYSLVQNAGIDLPRRSTLNCVGAGITCSDVSGKTEINVPGGGASAQIFTFSFVVSGNGSTVPTGDVNWFPPAPADCVIYDWTASGDVPGDAVLEVWKAAGAIPTSGDAISGSTPPTLSSAQLALGGSVAGWVTTTVTTNDVFGATVVSASTITNLLVEVHCQ